MRTHARELFVTALVFLAGVCLIAMACSWDIVTKGEVNGDDAKVIDAYESGHFGDTFPDSLFFKLFSEIEINGVTYDFVEMEVGELLDGDAGANDTLFVDHTP